MTIDQTKQAILKEWKKLCYDHEFDYINDGEKFLSESLDRLEKRVREEAIKQYELQKTCSHILDVIEEKDEYTKVYKCRNCGKIMQS